jgi:hypothetical protein
MFKYILEQAGGINWMGISALVTFFAIFVIATAVILRKNPEYIRKMSNMPLDDNTNPVTHHETAHHHEK